MAAPLDCQEIECWQVLLDADLPPDQMGRLEEHLQSCPVCQDRLDLAPEGEAELRRWAGRVGDPTAAPADPTLSRLLERMHEGCGLVPAAPVEPPDLYFLSPSSRPDILGTLGGYEVQEVIGQGGMGVVLKAYEPALHRLVAIKVLAAAVAGSATARRRFTREAKAAAAVCHDHIVAVHGVHEIDGLPYLVMQYVGGESLQERLDRTGPMAVPDVVRVGAQIASGLAAAHAQGLIHRDIKPANILLDAGVRGQETGVRDQESGVKITDFGLARMADDVQLTQAGVVAGTPEYMAPEQARGESADHRSDLFSLGSVLYACCTGTAPFRGPTPLALLHAVNERAPAPLRALNPGVPAWLELLIARLMAKDPGQRFQSAAEVAALLEGYLVHLRQPDTNPAPALPPVDGDKVTENADAGAVTLSPRHPVTLSFFRVAMLLLAVLAVLGGAAALLLFGQGNQIEERPPDANQKQAADPADVLPDPYVVWSVAISPDGKTLAAGAGWWTTGGEVGVWDLATHKPLRRFVEARGVVSVAFSADSKLLAFGSWTHHVRVLDWAAGKELCEFAVDGLAHVAFAPAGPLLATASEGQALQLWDVAEGELVAHLEGDLLRFQRVTFSRDGKRLLAGGGDWKPGGINHVGVWDVATKKQVLKLAGHNNTVFCLACSPDGKTIATGSVDRTIRLYDAETGLPQGTLRGPMREVDSLVFSADSKTLVSSGPESVVRFWDVDQGKETRRLATGITHVRALALTADDKTLIVGGQHKTLKIFDLETGKETAVLWNGADPQKLDMDALPASTPEKADEAQAHPQLRLLLLALATALTVGMIVWTLARRGRIVCRPLAQTRADNPAVDQKTDEVFFACSACGAKLKAKGALAGKKVKCSRCARTMCVPST
ncbi:MAG: serine/threonine protein kinase [Gemmataceae bacterium]|nr:serine/threonine protein kinase [Gemmataceae bacterium]